MLSFSESGHSRRDFLSIGSLALGGLTLPGLLASQAQAGSNGGGGILRDKAVVFLFMHGGPSQIETFDPKMTAPSEIRSVTGEIKTSLKGVTYGGTFEKLAKLANKTTIVRSFKTGSGAHDIKPIMCEETLKANIGSLAARIGGANDAGTGMPTNVALFPRAVDDAAQPGNMRFGKFTATGPLGSAYAPFMPGGEGTLQQNMTLRMERKRLDDRRHLLQRVDRLKRALDSASAAGAVDRFQQQAFDTILGGVADAFDLSKEDPKTLAMYDTAPLVHPDSIRKVWNNHKNYRDHGQSLGKLMLLARRLCERGCRFVTVTTNFVWDMHADANNATMTEGMRYCGLPFDHAVSAFIRDVEARGLSDRILLVCCGEMGRTPKINKKGGRDHWGNIAPLLLHGGGLRMGQVIGESSRDAGEPHTEPITNAHLLSTIMHTLFDLGQLRIAGGVPEDVMRAITKVEPIAGLV